MRQAGESGITRAVSRPSGSPQFVTTHWTLVLAAGDDAAPAAREELARRYWYPLYAFARWRGAPPEDAADAVQAFLGRLLGGGALAGLGMAGGRFRDFLRAGLAHELVSRHRAEHAACRRPAGGVLELADAEPRFAGEPAKDGTPEQAYDRLCARTLLDAAFEELRGEYAAAGREALFHHLAAHLDGGPEAASHAEAAQALGLAPGTVRNEAGLFRRRFQSLLRRQVRATLDDPGRTDEELRELLAAVAAR